MTTTAITSQWYASLGTLIPITDRVQANGWLGETVDRFDLLINQSSLVRLTWLLTKSIADPKQNISLLRIILEIHSSNFIRNCFILSNQL